MSHDTEKLAHDLRAAREDLARARSKPLKNVAQFLIYRALIVLSRATPPLPGSMTRRFARSAAKRDPNRSIRVAGAVPGSQDQMPAEITGVVTRYTGKVARDPAKPDILVVSHDASRTGAPILALNLVQAFSARYNVTTLCLRGGSLVGAFRDHSVSVQVAERPEGTSRFYTNVLREVRVEHGFAFAVVNSIESRHMLVPLKKNGVPSVTLLHEFASYTPSKTAFRDAIACASHVVFSTQLTLDNALETSHIARTPAMHVLPQGKCVVPSDGRAQSQDAAEVDRLTRLLRPQGQTPRRFLVIGAGYVQIRKGVDLFIDMAMRVLSRPEGRDALFVWVGAGYAPDSDFAYSVYLRDQLQRAGLTDRVLFLPETSEIETVYRLADVLALTSRLDPLPNVAIDAMCAGLPVLCFARTTGIAETLSSAGLAEACVAGYLDTAGMADMVIRLASDAAHLENVKEMTCTYAAQAFDFDAYARRIEALALEDRNEAKADAATIAQAGTFSPDFSVGKPHGRMSEKDAILTYLEGVRTGVNSRKPQPGFHPYVFADVMGSALKRGADPYAEFIRMGCPDGPWLTRVIAGGDGVAAPLEAPGLSSALHIHAFHTDQLDDIAARLTLNAARPDLYISVADAAGARAARAALSRYAGRLAAVEIVPNAGRDIGPLLTGFGPDLVQGYELIGHVHTKKSGHLQNQTFIGRWVDFTLSGVIGGKAAGPMMDRILAAAAADAKLGVVYPDDPFLMGWTGNRPAATRLADRLGLASLPDAFNFPIGTMFWMRAGALRPFVELGLTWSDYPVEPAPTDGTILHALERLFGIVPPVHGWDTAVTHTRGLTR